MFKTNETAEGAHVPISNVPTPNGLLPVADQLHKHIEDLAEVNRRLQNEVERQRSARSDLENLLASTNHAAIVLDRPLTVRFLTPDTHHLFNVLPEIGDSLADLNLLADDPHLHADAIAVLANGMPVEREIAFPGTHYLRYIRPYLTPMNGIEGVVISLVDVTEQRRVAQALDADRRRADSAKTRFLASASHDLRQPLQTLALLQGLLAKTVNGTKQQELVARVDDTVTAMTGILNTLLDINQIEAGVVLPEKTDFPISELLERMHDEFAYLAVAQSITLKTVASSEVVHTDRLRLEQMVRNLCSNALKYTRSGKVLIGCRRRGDNLNIEIWDTGLGIAGEEIGSIFDEYYQLAKSGRERSRGFGLGLSIVRRLGDLLGHTLHVKSQPGRGSVFSIEVPTVRREALNAVTPVRMAEPAIAQHRSAFILVIDDDPDVLNLLDMLVQDDGHRTATATDGATALAIIESGSFRPDLVLSDLSLPNGVDGLAVARQIRVMLHRQVPVIILTGDISTETMHNIAREDCTQLYKPASLGGLTRAIQDRLALLPPTSDVAAHRLSSLPRGDAPPVVFVVDDDPQLSDAIRMIFEGDGCEVHTYATGEDFLAENRAQKDGCLLIDAQLPGMSGLELLAALRPNGHTLPAIMITGNSEVSMAIAAMKGGAIDFIEKPTSRVDLLACVARALKLSRDGSAERRLRESATRHIDSLTHRQKQIMELVLAGHPSKNIAADLGISQRTVENHRAAIMRKTGTKSLPALARLAVVVSKPVSRNRQSL